MSAARRAQTTTLVHRDGPRPGRYQFRLLAGQALAAYHTARTAAPATVAETPLPKTHAAWFAELEYTGRLIARTPRDRQIAKALEARGLVALEALGTGHGFAVTKAATA